MDGLTQRREECRDARGVGLIDNTVQDLRYSIRILAKTPAFTAVAVVTLALAIAANAVVFGALDALILRPLNVPEPDTLYTIEHGNEKWTTLSYPDYVDLRDRNRSFDRLAAYNNSEVALDTGDGANTAFADEVSGNYFAVFRVHPFLGRFIQPGDEGCIVLTYAYWHSRFHEDRGIVGRTVRLNKRPFAIIGVAPPGFHGPVSFFGQDFFIPLIRKNSLDERSNLSLLMTVGHLKPGISPRQAIGDLDSIGAWLQRTYPGSEDKLKFRVAHPNLFGDVSGNGTRGFLAALMVLAALILLAACANLGSLFAARAADRSRDVALRLALGARRGRIVRTLFTEAIVISLLGGAAGVWAGVNVLRGLSAWQPFAKYPVRMNFDPGAKVYAVAVLLTVAAGFLFGAAPLRQVFQTDPYHIVKSGSRATSGRRITFREVLVVAQIAICAVLVTASMVAVRGMKRSLGSDFGFEPRDAMLMDTDLNMAGYRGEAATALEKRILRAMQDIPGVKAAALISLPPVASAGDTDARPVFNAGTADLRPANAAFLAATYSISPEYFRAAGTTLVAGRAFTWRDDESASRVAVVNNEFARRLYRSASKAIGGSYRLKDGARVQVVGVAEDGKYGQLTENQLPAMFLPILQEQSSSATVVVRSELDPHEVAAAMRSRLRALDPGIPAYIQTWRQGLGPILFAARMATLALGVLGSMGAMLAITGIFGTAAYSVSRRLKELGIRMALGAQRWEVLRAALGRPLKLLVWGSGAGLLLGILASRVVGAIVYTATPRDPMVLGGAVAAMGMTGLLATWIPARRALSLDPVKLLREE
ncbi:MAG TPA: ABC transporter permease, partial [Bryobacteraceae bacterium]|nr:ABC transporter permease [Bryobacteraceae bacterium]